MSSIRNEDESNKNIGRLRRRRRLVTTQWLIIMQSMTGGVEEDFYTDPLQTIYTDESGVSGYVHFPD